MDTLEKLSRAALVLEHHGLVERTTPTNQESQHRSCTAHGRRYQTIQAVVKTVKELVDALMRKDGHIRNALEKVGSASDRGNEELWASLEEARPTAAPQKVTHVWVEQVRAELEKAEAKAVLEWEQIKDELASLLQMVEVVGNHECFCKLLIHPELVHFQATNMS